MSNSQFMEIWSMLDGINKKLDKLIKNDEKQTQIISGNQPKADEKTDQQNPPLMPFRL